MASLLAHRASKSPTRALVGHQGANSSPAGSLGGGGWRGAGVRAAPEAAAGGGGGGDVGGGDGGGRGRRRRRRRRGCRRPSPDRRGRRRALVRRFGFLPGRRIVGLRHPLALVACPSRAECASRGPAGPVAPVAPAVASATTASPTSGGGGGGSGLASSDGSDRDRGDVAGRAGAEPRDVGPSDPASSHAPDQASTAPDSPPCRSESPAKVSRRFGTRIRTRADARSGGPGQAPRRDRGRARQRIESGRRRSSTPTLGHAQDGVRDPPANEADYRFYRFCGRARLLDDLDHSLKITDGVLRFRIFKVDAATPVIVAAPDDAADARGRDPREAREGGGRGAPRGRGRRRGGRRRREPAAEEPAEQPRRGRRRARRRAPRAGEAAEAPGRGARAAPRPPEAAAGRGRRAGRARPGQPAVAAEPASCGSRARTSAARGREAADAAT